MVRTNIKELLWRPKLNTQVHIKKNAKSGLFVEGDGNATPQGSDNDTWLTEVIFFSLDFVRRLTFHVALRPDDGPAPVLR